MNTTSTLQPLSKFVQSALRTVEQASGCARSTTGISELDRYVGGWLPATVTVIEGDLRLRHPSDLLAQLAAMGAVEGAPTAFFCLDTTVSTVALRMLEVVAGGALRDLWPEDTPEARLVDRIGARERLDAAAERLAAAPLVFNDTYDLTTDDIGRSCCELRGEHETLAVFVDSIHGVARGEERLERVLYSLSDIAKSLEIPILVSARPNTIEPRARCAPSVLLRLAVHEPEDIGLPAPWPRKNLDNHEPFSLPAQATFDVVKNAFGPLGAFDVEYEPACRRCDRARATTGGVNDAVHS